MDIVDLVDSLQPVNYTCVLGACWTDDKSLCSPTMLASGEQMLNDMIECQDLISAIYYADKLGIDIPQLQANLSDGSDPSVLTTILSPVSEEFFQLFTSIENGQDAFGLKERFKDPKYTITYIRQTSAMKQFQFSHVDNVKIINATQKQR